MNLTEGFGELQAYLFRMRLGFRRLFPRRKLTAFGQSTKKIQQIAIINLNRQPARWQRSVKELHLLRTEDGHSLAKLARRVQAVDARDQREIASTGDVDPILSLIHI